MTFMPEFKPSAVEFSHERNMKREAGLLRQRSRESLSSLFINHRLSGSESVYTARLETELRILEDRDFCGYFLIVADYVRWAKDNGIAVGPGRGSGPCSLIGFVLGITQVDPIEYGLPFERFVNPEKESLPDFDVEFCGERYGEVTNYLQSEYGADRVALISSDDANASPSRLVICDRPLAELVPLDSNKETGMAVTRISLAQIKEAGLVKFNVIGQQALTKIQRTVQELAESGTDIDIDNIALDDIGTYRLLCTGEASNIAVLDGEDYKNTLEMVKPECFEELCAVIALCYPKLSGSIPLYVERKHNPDLIHYYHIALERVTAVTNGVLLYQEQLMQITHEIAGFSMSQGDLFRRSLKNTDRKIVFDYKKMFVGGAIESGLSKIEATDLFEHLVISGSNTFNKSHAIAFARVAYQTAWLKANHASTLL